MGLFQMALGRGASSLTEALANAGRVGETDVGRQKMAESDRIAQQNWNVHFVNQTTQARLEQDGAPSLTESAEKA